MLSKFYSLDECLEKDEVYSHLEELKEDGKIYFDTVDLDVIKIKDTGLNVKELKDLVKYFEENDVIEYDSFEPRDFSVDEDWDGDDWEDEDYEDYEDEF